MPDLPVPVDGPLHERTARIAALKHQPVFRSGGGMLIDGQTKFLTHRFPRDFHDELECILITDVQFGHRHCRTDKLIEFRDWLLAKPHRFCFWGGDMVDAATVNSPGGTYDNLFAPESQVYQFCEILAPVVHRTLGFVGGNHERRGLAGGFDLGSLIAYVLGIPYSAGAQMISVYHGAHNPFKVYLWHGRGAARSPGGRVNMTLGAVPNDEAQIYLSGHIHSAHCYPGWHLRRDYRRSRMVGEAYYVLSASSFLEFYGSYAEVHGFQFTEIMMPKFLIHAEGSYSVVFKTPVERVREPERKK